jgi:hypothetical protein
MSKGNSRLMGKALGGTIAAALMLGALPAHAGNWGGDLAKAWDNTAGKAGRWAAKNPVPAAILVVGAATGYAIAVQGGTAVFTVSVEGAAVPIASTHLGAAVAGTGAALAATQSAPTKKSGAGGASSPDSAAPRRTERDTPPAPPSIVAASQVKLQYAQDVLAYAKEHRLSPEQPGTSIALMPLLKAGQLLTGIPGTLTDTPAGDDVAGKNVKKAMEELLKSLGDGKPPGWLQVAKTAAPSRTTTDEQELLVARDHVRKALSEELIHHHLHTEPQKLVVEDVCRFQACVSASQALP